jgi:DNA-binding MltR family transcriptional regulator
MDIDWPFTDGFGKALGNAIRITEELKDESDRGVVLVSAAFLDELLEELLRAHFISDSKITDELLSNSGPLGSFSARSKLAYCLDLIHETQFRDLETVRKIRNEFAHSHRPATFDSDRIRDLCQNLKYAQLVPDWKDKSGFAQLFPGPETTRTKFVAGSLALFAGLMNAAGMSTAGIIDATRFVERDAETNDGAHLQWLIDEFTN